MGIKLYTLHYNAVFVVDAGGITEAKGMKEPELQRIPMGKWKTIRTMTGKKS
jgi:hypothetical protein